MTGGPRFHGECDVAAMVYGPGDAPDPLLQAFVGGLLGLGYDAVGVVQQRAPARSGFDGSVDLRLIPDDDRRPDREPAAACGTALQGIGVRLIEALKRQPDLVALNRWGSQEAAGAGLTDVLAEAIERDIPVVIAVPEALFPDWLATTQGLAVRLQPRRESLERWWRSLGRPPSGAGAAPTFCERFK